MKFDWWTPGRFGALAVVGAMGFVAIVLALQVLQPRYDPVHQLMSELAIGAYGWTMGAAFSCLATATLAVSAGLARQRPSPLMHIVRGIAALGFLGAGVFPLGNAPDLHIVLIALAFIGLVLAMVLVPSFVPGQFGGRARSVSLSLAVGTALSVFIGGTVLPIGVSQRLAAVCVVVWLCFMGLRLRWPNVS